MGSWQKAESRKQKAERPSYGLNSARSARLPSPVGRGWPAAGALISRSGTGEGLLKTREAESHRGLPEDSCVFRTVRLQAEAIRVRYHFLFRRRSNRGIFFRRPLFRPISRQCYTISRRALCLCLDFPHSVTMPLKPRSCRARRQLGSRFRVLVESLR